MSTENSDQTNLSEKKDFLVNSSSLKDVRSFSREVFDKLKLEQLADWILEDNLNGTSWRRS